MESFSSPVIRRVQRRDRTRAAAAYLAIGLAALSLISALLRPLHSRLHGPLSEIPEFLSQVSTIYVVFLSFGLFLLARYLRAGSRLAWGGSLALLVMIAILHGGKPVDWPLAVLCLLTAAWLGVRHRAFPVRPDPRWLRRTLLYGGGALLAASLVVAGLVVQLALSTHQKVGSGARQFFSVLAAELHEHHLALDWALFAAMVLSLLGLLYFSLFAEQRKYAPDSTEHEASRERARAVIARHGGGTLDYFALRDDKQWFFLGDSVVACAVRGGVCLVSPDPIGPVEQREEIWAEFMLMTERRGLSVSVLGAVADWLPIYEHSGLRSLYLGDEAIVESATFSLSGKRFKSLRQGYTRVQRAGYRAEHVNPLELDAQQRSRLRELVTDSRRGQVERGFSMTLSRLFDPADTELMLSIAYDEQSVAQAFIQWIPARDINGWSLDVMRRGTSPELPGGLMDFLIIEMLGQLARQGGGGLGLNFAVLREAVAGGKSASWLEQVVARQASKHAQVESLWRFNAKYDPRWQPRYAAMGSVDLWLAQGLRMAQAEGLAELPVLPAFPARRRGQ